MATLQIADIDDRLYSTIAAQANADRKSIGEEALAVLERYFLPVGAAPEQAVREFLKLSWDDDRSADEIIRDLESSRMNKRDADDGIFD